MDNTSETSESPLHQTGFTERNHQQDLIDKCLAEKEKGNEYYRNGQLEKAIEAYTQALQYDATNAVVLSNRAISNYMLNRFTECETDCTLSLQFDPCYVKSYLRRGAAMLQLVKLDEAILDFVRALELDPTNQQAKSAIECLYKQELSPKTGQSDMGAPAPELSSLLSTSGVDITHTYDKHEVEVSEGDESSLQKLFQTCKKNPGHTEFIPVPTFNMQHLPEDFRDDDLFELIKATAELTVRISVKIISPNRPKYFPNTTSPYPFYNMGGKTSIRAGSGEIGVLKYIHGFGLNASGKRSDILKRTYSTETRSCPCEKCKDSDKPSCIWWQIYISTAAHVVFDETEVSQASCRLFFDDQNSLKVMLEKLTFDLMNVERDKCVMRVATCDVTLGERLFQTTGRWVRLWMKVTEKFSKSSENEFNFIVSHPHGCSKQISVGQLVKNEKVFQVNEEFDLTKLSYNTCTCPGSSGAPVHCLGFRHGHVHNGACSGLNYSSVDFCHRVVPAISKSH